MDRRYEVVVVGAGPSGSAAAHVCAKAGLSTLLIEEQAHIGVPIQCAGLLSCSAFQECRVSLNSVLHTVSGATITAEHASLSFDAGKTKAYVVDRSLLDQEMGLAAADAGADIQLKTRVCRLSPLLHTIMTSGAYGRENVKYTILIAADGPRASMGRMAGLPRAPVYLSGLQSDIPYETDIDKVTIYPNASPEFFGWAIPLGKGRTRVGLCGITHVKEKFERFLAGFGSRRMNFVSGTIPLGTLQRTMAEGLMVVGDAAALAKPTSGGGVYTGIRSARHAAAVALHACEENRSDPAFLSEYEQRWKKDLGRELKRGYAAFRFRQMISPVDMVKVINHMDDQSIRNTIVRRGDMDRPGRLIGNLLVHPRMYSAIGILLQSYIRNYLS
jgi:geranylgeranyl reductase family protein